MIYGTSKYVITKGFEALSFQDSHSSGILDQPITLTEVSHVVRVVINHKSARLDCIFVRKLKMKVSLHVKFG